MTVEAEDPEHEAETPLTFFGKEVLVTRERWKISREQLANEAACGYSLVAKIEKGDRTPSLEFARACDRIFPNAEGRFERLYPLALRFAFPPWFRRYVKLEWKATAVRMFHPQLMPGLVQTEGYARAVLRTGRPPNLESLVTGRIERQRILNREENPARLWVVLNEAALTNQVGSPEVMHQQLGRLLELADTPRHRVLVVPDEGQHHGWASPFGILSFKDDDDKVHVDGFPRGYLLAEPEDVQRASDAYDLLVALALSPDKSAALIETTQKERYS
ncbi:MULTISPECIES: helix-turn-helix transcriptional regulator [Streptomyces]|uniref:helix-turn-helix domain-containing protein n=1 Tax=Streptomyces TaxID=1883 RepID=UPI0011A139FB|nr:helix-turn-helix transcriptional regulator [Streptomyces sp. CFMR 7]